MRPPLIPILLALLPLSCAAAPDGPARIYVHVYSAGFEHGVAKPGADGAPSLVEAKWAEWAADDQRFEVVVSREAPDSLDGFDGVFLYTTGELPWSEEQRAMLLGFVRGGGGLVGSHCATDTWYEWTDYGLMIGGYFAGHPWNEDVGVEVEVTDHPATAHLGESFRIADEIYQHKEPWSRERLTVLMGLDHAATDMEKDGIYREDRDVAISWIRDEGQGRVFYTGLGHRPEVWNDARFQQHLVEGALWAAGR
ncbi:MAG: ThuA domain-containing protein [Planctomycetes bacterium]|nr:ThuA domain-containing protein [Planctomycetota bacterium]MBL7008773.1 ThuA domain-containing protein [Planctomycetota bacterium]